MKLRTGPLMVPVPSRSPGLMLHPLIVWCANCCVTVQYLQNLLKNVIRKSNVYLFRERERVFEISQMLEVALCDNGRLIMVLGFDRNLFCKVNLYHSNKNNSSNQGLLLSQLIKKTKHMTIK